MGSVKQYATKPYLKGVDVINFDEASEE